MSDKQQLAIVENPKEIPDIGFKVFKLDQSNFRRFDGEKDIEQLYEEAILGGRTNEDIIYEVMLKWGIELGLPVEKKAIAGYEVYSVAADTLICCMDQGLTVEVLEAIAAVKPDRVLILDSVLDDSLKLNAAHIFKSKVSKDGVTDEKTIELRTL
jgi:adenine-specific DNA-methyltransferase